MRAWSRDHDLYVKGATNGVACPHAPLSGRVSALALAIPDDNTCSLSSPSCTHFFQLGLSLPSLHRPLLRVFLLFLFIFGTFFIIFSPVYRIAYRLMNAPQFPGHYRPLVIQSTSTWVKPPSHQSPAPNNEAGAHRVKDVWARRAETLCAGRVLTGLQQLRYPLRITVLMSCYR